MATVSQQAVGESAESGSASVEAPQNAALDALRDLMMATHQFRQAVANRLDVNYIDTLALSFLVGGDGVPAGELAHRLGISAGTATAVLDRLQRGGYINRRRSEVDRRALEITLTDKGRTLVAHTREMMIAVAASTQLSLADVARTLGQMAESLRAQAERVGQADLLAPLR